MAPDFHRLAIVIKRVVAVARNDQVTFLAASIAFYAFLSLFPLLLLVLVLGSIFGGVEFAAAILNAVNELLTPQAQAVLTEALLEEAGRSGAGIAGLVFLVWSGLRVFRGLAIAFDMIYGGGVELSFRGTVVHGLTVFGAIGVGLVGIFVMRTWLALLSVPPLWKRLSVIPLFLGLMVLFFPMYYLFPRQYHGARGALPGALFAAAGWTLLGEVFAIYAANAGTFALFGLIGGVLLLLTWFYFGAIILLTGAVINAVLAGREVGASAIVSRRSRPQADHPEG